MSYNLDRLSSLMARGDGRSEATRKAFTTYRNNPEFSPMYMFDLAGRSVQLRFAPESPDKLPDGFLDVAFHQLISIAGEYSSAYKVECLKSLEQPCYICEFEAAIAPYLSTKSLDPGTKEALLGIPNTAFKGISCQQNIHVVMITNLIPVIVQKEEYSDTTWGPEKGGEHGAVLQLKMRSNLWADLCNAMTAHPDISDMRTGRWMTLDMNTNMAKHTLVVGQPSPLKDLELLKSYPDVVKRIKGSKKFSSLSYGEMETAVASCYWSKHSVIREVMQEMKEGGAAYTLDGGHTTVGAIGGKAPEFKLPEMDWDLPFVG